MLPTTPGTKTCISVLGLKLLWKEALPFTMSNSWFHGCPYRNLDSISPYVIDSNFSYFENFFPEFGNIFWGIIPPESSENISSLAPFPIKLSLGCQIYGLHGNFLELPLILWSQKKKDPASNFTMLPGRLQSLIQERCPQKRQGRAPRSPQAVTILPIAPLPTPAHHPSTTLERGKGLWPHISEVPSMTHASLHAIGYWIFRVP